MRYTLAYDSDCGPCTRFRNAIAFIDGGRRLRYVSLERADSMGLLDAVEPGLRFASFHLVSPTGKVWSGAAALPVLASLLPGGSVPSFIMRRNRFAFRGTESVYSVLSRLHGTGTCTAGGAGSRVPIRDHEGLASPIKVDINID